MVKQNNISLNFEALERLENRKENVDEIYIEVKNKNWNEIIKPEQPESIICLPEEEKKKKEITLSIQKQNSNYFLKGKKPEDKLKVFQLEKQNPIKFNVDGDGNNHWKNNNNIKVANEISEFMFKGKEKKEQTEVFEIIPVDIQSYGSLGLGDKNKIISEKKIISKKNNKKNTNVKFIDLPRNKNKDERTLWMKQNNSGSSGGRIGRSNQQSHIFTNQTLNNYHQMLNNDKNHGLYNGFNSKTKYSCNGVPNDSLKTKHMYSYKPNTEYRDNFVEKPFSGEHKTNNEWRNYNQYTNQKSSVFPFT